MKHMRIFILSCTILFVFQFTFSAKGGECGLFKNFVYNSPNYKDVRDGKEYLRPVIMSDGTCQERQYVKDQMVQGTFLGSLYGNDGKTEHEKFAAQMREFSRTNPKPKLNMPRE